MLIVDVEVEVGVGSAIGVVFGGVIGAEWEVVDVFDCRDSIEGIRESRKSLLAWCCVMDASLVS
jgi:hypothetical protein